MAVIFIHILQRKTPRLREPWGDLPKATHCTCGGVNRELRAQTWRTTTCTEHRHPSSHLQNSTDKGWGLPHTCALTHLSGICTSTPQACAQSSAGRLRAANVGGCLCHHPRPFQMASHLGIPEQPHLLLETCFSRVESVSGEQPAGESTTPAFPGVASRTPGHGVLLPKLKLCTVLGPHLGF